MTGRRLPCFIAKLSIIQRRSHDKLSGKSRQSSWETMQQLFDQSEDNNTFGWSAFRKQPIQYLNANQLQKPSSVSNLHLLEFSVICQSRSDYLFNKSINFIRIYLNRPPMIDSAHMSYIRHFTIYITQLTLNTTLGWLSESARTSIWGFEA